MAKPSRSRSRVASYGVLDGASRLFRKFFHGLLCLAALVLGFRLSGEAVLFLGTSSKDALFNRRSSIGLHLEGIDVALKFPYITEATQGSSLADLKLHGRNTSQSTDNQVKQQPPPPQRKSSRVNVGRHEILIRSQPHPDPLQSFTAHNLLKLVQHEQMLLYESEEYKRFLVVTPTFARTFQALHLTCLIHTLRTVPFPLTWIVVEAGGVSHETAALLSTSQVSFHHVGFPEAMPVPLEQRPQMEVRLRTEGLRFIREKKLDGIVIFMDDSITYSSDFFKEAQKTKWIGGFSVGLLSDFSVTKDAGETLVSANEKSSSSMPSTLQLQGPVCDRSEHMIGWFAPVEAAGDFGLQGRGALEWAGFSLNGKLLWEGYEMPAGFRSWNEGLKQSENFIQSPLDFVQNSTLVEPLGDCGRSILLWQLRTEARADSKFPSR
ncbi:hypothetical protein GOP47_0018001 [Adiantum capillus-veneris]|uniref:Glycosyltransferases n=1 Tax=Adiantum capillus-veneris TaxID=13818 RepID=A0A9D4UHD8_ADICA|nr:hypothetical protein GOP47_0018001 [Adiantum capillus-veneris]